MLLFVPELPESLCKQYRAECSHLRPQAVAADFPTVILILVFFFFDAQNTV